MTVVTGNNFCPRSKFPVMNQFVSVSGLAWTVAALLARSWPISVRSSFGFCRKYAFDVSGIEISEPDGIPMLRFGSSGSTLFEVIA